jgi:hypothetical protein
MFRREVPLGERVPPVERRVPPLPVLAGLAAACALGCL